jgi:hypothetical protein
MFGGKYMIYVKVNSQNELRFGLACLGLACLMSHHQIFKQHQRQIHLDFHTSPHIPDVGCDFDAEAFAATMKRAHVNSVTVFAKCHHGMCYYPTQTGVSHPAIGDRDLLGEQI